MFGWFNTLYYKGKVVGKSKSQFKYSCQKYYIHVSYFDGDSLAKSKTIRVDKLTYDTVIDTDLILIKG